MVYLKLIFLSFLFVCSLTVSAAETHKLKQIKCISEIWGAFAFNSSLTQEESKQFTQMLSREFEHLDTSKTEACVSFRQSYLRLSNFAKAHQNKKQLESAKLEKYSLIHTDLLDFLEFDCLTDSDRTYLDRLIQHTHANENTSKLIPQYYVGQHLDSVNVLGDFAIESKYNALAIFAYYWNVCNYFSPYPINKRNKDSIFYAGAEKLIKADSHLLNQYRTVMSLAFASQEDSHISPVNYYPGVLRQYIRLKIIGQKAIISDLLPAFDKQYNLQVGDQILLMNDDSISSKIRRLKPHLYSSNKVLSDKRLKETLLYHWDTVFTISVARGDSIFEIKINQAQLKRSIFIENYKLPSYSVLNDSVVYINAAKAPEKELKRYLKKARKMKHIILDYREYPQASYLHKSLVEKVVTKEINYCSLRRCANNNHPGYYQLENLESTRDNVLSLSPKRAARYSEGKKFYFMVNEHTISRGEFMVMYFKAHTDGLVIGRSTAGVPSNVLALKLPELNPFFITVFQVWDSNGCLISGKGIAPDIWVEDRITSERQLEAILTDYLKHNYKVFE